MIDFTGFFHMMNPDHVAQSLSVALVLKWLYTQDINNTCPYLHEICRGYSWLPAMYHLGTVSVRIQFIKEPTAFITQVPKPPLCKRKTVYFSLRALSINTSTLVLMDSTIKYWSRNQLDCIISNIWETDHLLV